jgi:hypothetical protein
MHRLFNSWASARERAPFHRGAGRMLLLLVSGIALFIFPRETNYGRAIVFRS